MSLLPHTTAQQLGNQAAQLWVARHHTSSARHARLHQQRRETQQQAPHLVPAVDTLQLSARPPRQHARFARASRRWSARRGEGPGADARRNVCTARVVPAASNSGTAPGLPCPKDVKLGRACCGCKARRAARVAAL